MGMKVAGRQKKLTQMVVDLGQRSLSEARCDQCGMVYSAGLPEDERIHKRHHKNSLRRPRLWDNPSKSGMLLVGRHADGLIFQTSSRSAVDRILRPLDALRLAYSTQESFDTSFFYVAPDTRHVIAGVLVDKIHSGCRGTLPGCLSAKTDAGTAELGQKGPGSPAGAAEHAHTAKAVGFRNFFATDVREASAVLNALLDTARRHSYYGAEVPKQLCAVQRASIRCDKVRNLVISLFGSGHVHGYVHPAVLSRERFGDDEVHAVAAHGGPQRVFGRESI